MQDLPGEAHALAVAQLAADHHAGHNARPVDALDAEGEQTVVHQDGVARLKILGNPGVADRNDRLVALNVLGGKGEDVPVAKHDRAVLEGLYPVLGSLGVKQDRDRQAKLLAHAFDELDLLLVVGVRAVRKIEACDVHAGAAHGDEGIAALRCRADGANDLGFSHSITSWYSRISVMSISQIRRKVNKAGSLFCRIVR